MNRLRRPLDFARIEDVIPDVDRLMLGHRTVGRWTLGQILGHLASAIDYSMGGYPQPPLPLPARAVLGPIAKWSILSRGKIMEGAPLPLAYRPSPDLHATAESGRLREAIGRLVAFGGPFALHPIAGTMSPEQWLRFHRVHCAHHLSFALPEAQS
ncbi:MAG: DUF1569 domain-containing protein [Isosphaeraceae bacterium]